ncbi:MAG: hypothetical protein AAF657_41705, partial [Acidobacteriota bacterium]
MYRFLGDTTRLELHPYPATSSLAFVRTVDAEPSDEIHVMGDPVSEIWIGSSGGSPETHPLGLEDLSNEQRAAISTLEKQLIESIEAEIPLGEDEELISDALTLLAQPFDGHRVGAAVIERKTTQAELYFIFDDVRSESEAF